MGCLKNSVNRLIRKILYHSRSDSDSFVKN